MNIESITSLNNPKVKKWMQLLHNKGRQQQGLFLAEGIHLVEEAMRAEADIEAILYDGQFGWPHELGHFDLAGVHLYEVTDRILAKCTDTVQPQPVIAVVRKPKQSLQQWLDQKPSLALLVDRIQDPGNLGTMIRSADAVGADGVVLGTGTVDLYNPKTVRATMGSLFHIPVVESELLPLLEWAQRDRIQTVHTSLQAQDDCYSLNMKEPIWFVIGNEAQGVAEKYHRYLSHQTKIPMHGKAESLNAAMAASILLYEAMRQRSYVK